MISRYEVTLNGVALSSLSSQILITDIVHDVPSISRETYSTAKRHGSHIHRTYRDKCSVSVQFAIRAYDIRERQEICQRVCSWAKNGGILMTNERGNDKQLHCICDSFPHISSALGWTDTVEMTFSAYILPFWEEVVPSTISLTATSASGKSGTLYVPGNVDNALVECTVTTNAEITELQLIVNDFNMTLGGSSVSMTVASGQTIKVKYDDDLILSIIRATSTSMMKYRTGADDLLAKCGENNTFKIIGKNGSSGASVTGVFSVRGLWM